MVGIYLIENKINGKRYIGQSWDIERRWNEHRNGKHKYHIESAIKKYGVQNFEFRVLCDLKEDEQNQQRLDDLEIAYIDILGTIDPKLGYNKTEGGSSGKRSLETREKMSKNNAMHNKANRDKISIASKGKAKTQEMRKKLSEAKKGRPSPMKGKTFSEEARRNMSIGAKGKVYSEEARRNMSRARLGIKQNVYSITKRVCSRLGYYVNFE